MFMRELDNGAVLEAIKVPSLIIQGKDDRIVCSLRVPRAGTSSKLLYDPRHRPDRRLWRPDQSRAAEIAESVFSRG
jgi:hypothetical protein